MKNTLLLLVAILLAFTVKSQDIIEYKYNFNSLETGNLGGQDGWTSVPNSVNKGDFTIDYAGNDGVTSLDGTKAAFFNFGGPNVGRTASRESTPAFPFNFSIGGVVEIEVEIYTAWWGTHFAVGYDKNNNGYIMPGIETVVNYESGEGGPGVHVANKPTIPDVFIKPDGTKIPFNFDISGWNTYKLFIDFGAYNKSGAASLSIKKAGGNWVSIPEVQSVNLGLTPGSGDRNDPAKWSKFFIHATGGSPAFDNLIIRQPNTGGLLYQYITFENIKDHLTTDQPFAVSASSNLNLPITYAIKSGPATINNNIITLTGEQGKVEVSANQSGNDTVAPASEVVSSFNVIDPQTIIPEIVIRNPINDSVVYSPNLDAFPISIETKIEHSDLVSITEVQILIAGAIIKASKAANGFYFTYWEPTAAGDYTMEVTAKTKHGVNKSKTINFTVLKSAPTLNRNIIDHVHFATVNNTYDTSFILPTLGGGYKKVMLEIDYGCPAGGCEPWDLTSYCNIRGANGDWIELVRYITPYGKACTDKVDVTDYISQLQGKIDITSWFPAKSVITISLIYEPGEPEYKYNWVEKMWFDTYPFGDWSNLQPVPVKNIKISEKIKSAHLRLVCSGHGGPNNSNNAAEFFETTHFIKINGAVKYNQKLWQNCNPNPVACQPQAGTWYYNRAGWCPGTIPMTFKFDLNDYLNQSFALQYMFDSVYRDHCHPQNPNCQSSSTCDCFNTYNPNIIVSGNLVKYSNDLIGPDIKVANVNPLKDAIIIKPNPSNGVFTMEYAYFAERNSAEVNIISMTGKNVYSFLWNGNQTTLNLDLTSGMYIVKIKNRLGVAMQKIIIL